MLITELTTEQLMEVYQFFLMDLVNNNKISWVTMCNRLYDNVNNHRKTLYKEFSNTSFTEDDFSQ